MSPPANSHTQTRALRLACGLGAAVGAMLAVLMLAPAKWVGDALSHASGQRFMLTQTQGSWWRGSGQLLLSGGAGSRSAMRVPGGLRWEIAPSWSGGVVRLDAPCCTPQGLELRIQPSLGMQGWGLRVQLMDQPSTWPAQLLAGLGTPWNTLQLSGPLQLSSQAFEMKITPHARHLAGTLTLQATALSSQLTTIRPMGSYTLTLRGGDVPSLSLSTAHGPLKLDGQGQWVGDKLRFNGQATAEPAQEAELANLLNIMGRRNGARSVITLG